MEKLLGRFRHRDSGPKMMWRVGDGREENFQAKLDTGDDCTCSKADQPDKKVGEPVEDEEPELTPVQRFKKASDAMHNIGPRKSSDAAAADTVALTPIQRFAAASKARWGKR